MSAPHAVPEQRLRVHGLRLLAVLDVRRGLLSREVARAQLRCAPGSLLRCSSVHIGVAKTESWLALRLSGGDGSSVSSSGGAPMRRCERESLSCSNAREPSLTHAHRASCASSVRREREGQVSGGRREYQHAQGTVR